MEGFFAENLRREAKHASPVPPGVLGQPRLPARLAEELFAGPAPLNRDLRQQEPTTMPLLDHQSVCANDDGVLISRSDLLQRTEDRNLQ